MNPTPEDISQILALLTQGPYRIEQATHNIEVTRLNLQSEAEPWSVNNILAHLRACADMWGASIRAMLTQDNPTKRYISPRSWMKKPKYAAQPFDAALASFTQERQELVKTLTTLNQTDWLRPGTFTGTSPRQRHQTVFSYAQRMVNHEQPHLNQIEALLQ
jgi:hypothetical protein